MKKLSMLFLLAFAVVQVASSQVQFKVPIVIQSGASIDTLRLGVSGDGPGGTLIDNTIFYDSAGTAEAGYVEDLAPPAPPAPYDLDVRFLTPLGYPLGLALRTDYRGFTNSSQVDTFRVKISGENSGAGELGATTISWPANLNLYAAAWQIRPRIGTPFPVTNMIGNTTLTFTPDAGTTSIELYIIKTGALNPAPVRFDVAPASLAFGDIIATQSAQRTLTVTNGGFSTALNITSISVPANYSIAPTTANIAFGASQVFTVTATAPGTYGAFSGNIVFTHNAAGSPTSFAVSANSIPPTKLQLSPDSITVWDNTKNTYLDSIRLVDLSARLKAVEFTLKTNGRIILDSVVAGSNLPAANFTLATQFYRGDVNVDGSTNDSVRVLIYGKNQFDVLPAGTFNNLVRYTFDVVNQSAETLYSSITVSNVVASDSIGNQIQMAGSTQHITIYNRAYPGDINNDDGVNILDLLMIVDHILGRSTLAGNQFLRADVAPWPTGDGRVDVRDLTLLQNVIRTGFYPNGGQYGGEAIGRVVAAPPVLAGGTLQKSNMTQDVEFVFHVTKNGIAVHMINSVAVKGLQLDLQNVPLLPADTKVYSALGEGFASMLSGQVLRLLVYDANGGVLEAGDRLVANIPFPIGDPEKVVLKDLIVGGKNNQKISQVSSSMSLTNSPVLPSEFGLGQNYPNPFNPTTAITIAVPAAGDVRVSVYNLLGQEVRVLFSGQLAQGFHTLAWDGLNNDGQQLSSGTYLYRMTANGFVSTKKMMMLK